MITIDTQFPVALDSLDHTHPHGTAWDNSVWPAFNQKLFALISQPLLLDIGCAGGGLVRSVLKDGGFAVGIEGSDYSKKHERAEWPVIPHHLFTADATKPFQLNLDDKPLAFNIITAWEVFEHISEIDLSGAFDNISRHLSADGILAVSICTASAGITDECIEHHVNINPPEWWFDAFEDQGYVPDELLRRYFDPDWVRGPINGCLNSMCTVFRRAQ